MPIPETARTLSCAALLLAALGVSCASTESARRSWTVAPDGGWTLQPQVVDPTIVTPEGDPVAECADRRRKLAADLGTEGLVFLQGGSADGHGRFFQSDVFWYLSNVDLPDIALVLKLGPGGELLDEILFLPPKDENFEMWNGPRLAPGPEAASRTGFARTLPVPARGESYADALAQLGAQGTLFTLTAPDFEAPEGLTRETRPRMRSRLHAARLKKSAYEKACLQAAIDITTSALHQAMPAVGPGRHEYELQAAIDGTYLRLGSERPGFSSICATGMNAVTLHYEKNRDTMQDGDLVLMDVGAKYRYYCADVTRTVPVNGRFSERQRELYELVLKAQTAAAEAARPGMTLSDLHAVAKGVLEEAGYDQYFVHGLSHWIGLDVHDVGGRVPIQEDYLFTIEPGIYIADEGLGIRIEDDYLMTTDGAVKLSGAIPSDPDEIEALLASLQ
jgi:Xaa-Pro aminopeptidase